MVVAASCKQILSNLIVIAFYHAVPDRDFELLEMEKKQMEKFKIKAKQELEALRLQAC